MVAARSTSEDLDTILGALPARFRWVRRGPDHLVAGPTGLFLVAAPAADGLAATAARLAREAAWTRTALARELAWVPFVDALVVSDDDAPPGPATVVPTALLRRVLTEGCDILDGGTVDEVGRVAGRLWSRSGLDRMDGCSPPASSRPATASSSPSTTSVGTGRPSSSPTRPGSTAVSGLRWPGA